MLLVRLEQQHSHQVARSPVTVDSRRVFDVDDVSTLLSLAGNSLLWVPSHDSVQDSCLFGHVIVLSTKIVFHRMTRNRLRGRVLCCISADTRTRMEMQILRGSRHFRLPIMGSYLGPIC